MACLSRAFSEIVPPREGNGDLNLRAQAFENRAIQSRSFESLALWVVGRERHFDYHVKFANPARRLRYHVF
jgi:hypothetical protein